MAEQTRRYRIHIIDIATGEDVIRTAVDLTDKEKRLIVEQIARLAGAPPNATARLTGEGAPEPERGRH
jgi:hypothetical protein